jgi:integrase
MKNITIRRHGKKYQVRGPHRETGKRISIGTYPTKKEAEQAKKEYEHSLYTLTDFGRRETRTVADLAHVFLKDCEDRARWTADHNAWHERKALSAETLRSYRDALQRFIIPMLGPIVLIALRFEHLQKMVDGIKHKSMAIRAGESIKTILRFGNKRGWVIEPRLIGLLEDLRLPPRRRRDQLPSEASIRAVLGVVYGPRAGKLTRRGYLYRRAIWVLLVGNGLRRGEIAALDWANINWLESCIDIAGSWNRWHGKKPPKTKAGRRRVWPSSQAVDALLEIHEMHGRPEAGLVFKARDGQSIYGGMYAAYLLPVLKEAGIPREESKGLFHFHAMRHLSNSEMARLGVSKEARQANLGHSGRRDVTDGYTHLIEGDMSARNAAQAILEKYMPSSITAVDDALRLRPTAYHQWDPEKRRAYHRQYMRDYRAKLRALPAPAGQQGAKTSPSS